MKNLREETEKLLIRLNGYLNIDQKGINKLSDYELLSYINNRLIKLDCISYTEEELNVQLCMMAINSKN